jgi:hypothetical protein
MANENGLNSTTSDIHSGYNTKKNTRKFNTFRLSLVLVPSSLSSQLS